MLFSHPLILLMNKYELMQLHESWLSSIMIFLHIFLDCFWKFSFSAVKLGFLEIARRVWRRRRQYGDDHILHSCSGILVEGWSVVDSRLWPGLLSSVFFVLVMRTDWIAVILHIYWNYSFLFGRTSQTSLWVLKHLRFCDKEFGLLFRVDGFWIHVKAFSAILSIFTSFYSSYAPHLPCIWWVELYFQL